MFQQTERERELERELLAPHEHIIWTLVKLGATTHIGEDRSLLGLLIQMQTSSQNTFRHIQKSPIWVPLTQSS